MDYGLLMPTLDLVIEVRSGRNRLVIETLAALEHERSTPYQRAMRRLGISKASWHLAVLPGGTFLIAHLQGDDLAASLTQLGNASEGFESWLREQLGKIGGFKLDADTIARLVHEPSAVYSARLTRPEEHDEQMA